MAVLFGSSVDGTVNPGSDIDVAVLFDNPPDSGEQKLDYYTRLCDAADLDTVDMVILNEANPILAFEALSGKVICKNDVDRASEFQSLVCREYEDVIGNLEHQRQLGRQETV